MRHRGAPSSEDGLGKRRRPIDDEPDRSSKRSSRKESHRDDRSRRPPEKETHDRVRESDRRRKEREAPDNDGRGNAEKPAEKRIPEGPSPKNLPVNAPSAPRAMSSSEASRRQVELGPGRERARDQTSQGATPSSSGQPSADIPPQKASLRSRITEKETSSVPLPQAPSSYRSDAGWRDDDRDNRKRTVSDRDKEILDNAPTGDAGQPTKRPKHGRNRYASGGLARKLLPIDPSAADKSRGRKD